jgi:hypothetical protein
MIRLSAVVAILVQVALTAGLVTQVVAFGGASASEARPVPPAVPAPEHTKRRVHQTLIISFDEPAALPRH